jgi:HTH-type transcriptional regulator/antitoxin HigA
MAVKTTRKSYGDVLKQYEPQTIRSEREYNRMLAAADQLMQLRKRTAAEERVLDLIVALLQHYEDDRYPIPEAPPHRVLAHLIEAKNISQAELARETGVSRQLITEVLAGRRAISSSNVRKFADFFRVEPQVFLPAKEATLV